MNVKMLSCVESFIRTESSIGSSVPIRSTCSPYITPRRASPQNSERNPGTVALPVEAVAALILVEYSSLA